MESHTPHNTHLSTCATSNGLTVRHIGTYVPYGKYFGRGTSYICGTSYIHGSVKELMFYSLVLWQTKIEHSLSSTNLHTMPPLLNQHTFKKQGTVWKREDKRDQIKIVICFAQKNCTVFFNKTTRSPSSKYFLTQFLFKMCLQWYQSYTGCCRSPISHGFLIQYLWMAVAPPIFVANKNQSNLKIY